MAHSSLPTDAVVSISWQEVSDQTVTTEQGSGVLIAPDEVLTAAHLVYDAAGHLVTDATVKASDGTVATEASVRSMSLADWTQVASAAGDFAVIHLATPLTGLPVMALGSDFSGGAVTVTGYPVATGGAQDSVDETLAPLTGSTGILEGTPLGAPGDPHGASGGPAWQTVDGVATVVGLTSSANGSTGYFVGLTSADVAEIDAWVAADHAAAASPPVLTAPAPTSGSSASEAIAALSADATSLPTVASHPALDNAMSRVVSLLTRDAAALGTGAGFGDVAADALAQVGDNSAHRNLAAALLEGLVWGHDGGTLAGAVMGVAGTDAGVLSRPAAELSVHVGARLGQGLLASGY